MRSLTVVHMTQSETNKARPSNAFQNDCFVFDSSDDADGHFERRGVGDDHGKKVA